MMPKMSEAIAKPSVPGLGGGGPYPYGCGGGPYCGGAC